MITKEIVYFAIATVYLYAALKEYRKFRKTRSHDWAEIACYGSNAFLHGLLTVATSGH
jgi:hypothetical protein